MKDKRAAVTQLESVLVILVILLAGVAAYAFISKPAPQTTTTGAASAISKLKVALIVPIAASDNSWNYQAEASIKQLQKLYNFTLSITENKFDGSSAQPVAQQYASQGYNIIILQGIQYMVMASTIAGQYPNTMFVCVDCFAANYSNIYRVWWDMSEGAFIIGVMAGMVTHTNTLGLIGGGRVPSIWGGHEGFKAGALYANPNVKFTEKYEAFSWADSAGAQRDATLAYQNGADVVFSSGDGIDVGVISAALAASNSSSTQVWASNVYSNLSAIRPAVDKILLGSIVVDWSIIYNAALNSYVLGNWHNGYLTADMESGIVKVQPGPNVPANVKKVAYRLQNLFIQGASLLYFQTNPKTGDPLCFDQPSLPQCADTSLSNAAAQLNYLPSLSSLQS